MLDLAVKKVLREVRKTNGWIAMKIAMKIAERHIIRLINNKN